MVTPSPSVNAVATTAQFTFTSAVPSATALGHDSTPSKSKSADHSHSSGSNSASDIHPPVAVHPFGGGTPPNAFSPVASIGHLLALPSQPSATPFSISGLQPVGGGKDAHKSRRAVMHVVSTRDSPSATGAVTISVNPPSNAASSAEIEHVTRGMKQLSINNASSDTPPATVFHGRPATAAAVMRSESTHHLFARRTMNLRAGLSTGRAPPHELSSARKPKNVVHSSGHQVIKPTPLDFLVCSMKTEEVLLRIASFLLPNGNEIPTDVEELSLFFDGFSEKQKPNINWHAIFLVSKVFFKRMLWAFDKICEKGNVHLRERYFIAGIKPHPFYQYKEEYCLRFFLGDRKVQSVQSSPVILQFKDVKLPTGVVPQASCCSCLSSALVARVMPLGRFIPSWAELTRQYHVNELTVENCSMDAQTIEVLEGLTTLIKLHIHHDDQITDSAFKRRIQLLKRLTALSFKTCEKITNKMVVALSQSALNLHDLTLTYTQVTTLENFHRKLKRLTLGGPRITDETIRSLPTLLEYVKLTDCPVTDRGLEILGQIKTLRDVALDALQPLTTGVLCWKNTQKATFQGIIGAFYLHNLAVVTQVEGMLNGQQCREIKRIFDIKVIKDGEVQSTAAARLGKNLPPKRPRRDRRQRHTATILIAPHTPPTKTEASGTAAAPPSTPLMIMPAPHQQYAVSTATSIAWTLESEQDLHRPTTAPTATGVVVVDLASVHN